MIIDETARGQGLGQDVVSRIIRHPDLQKVQSFELYCPERLKHFQQKWEPVLRRTMRKINKESGFNGSFMMKTALIPFYEKQGFVRGSSCLMFQHP